MNERIKIMTKTIAPILIIGFLATGCGSPTGQSRHAQSQEPIEVHSADEDDLFMRASQIQAVVESPRIGKIRSQGAAYGGAIFGLAGWFIGGELGRAAVGAVFGVATGVIAGSITGECVARRQQEYASSALYLDACIEEATAANKIARQYNDSLRVEIASLDERVAKALTPPIATQSGEMTALRQDLKIELRLAEKNLEAVDAELARQKQAMAQVKTAATGQQTAATSAERLITLTAHVASLAKQKDDLTDLTSRLTAIDNRMSV